MAYFLIILSSFLYTVPLYFPHLYFLSWFSLLPVLYFIFKLKKENLNYKNTFFYGWFFGFFTLIFSANFLYQAVKIHTSFNFFLIIFLLIILFSLLAVIYGLFFLFFIYIQQSTFKDKRFSPFLMALMWTIFEFGRYHIFHFFPLANPAYTQAEFLTFIQIADLFGIWILIFIIILVNSLLFNFIFKKNYKSLIIIFLIMLAVLSYGRLKINYYDSLEKESENQIKLGIITTDITQKDKWSAAQLDKNLDLLIKAAEFLNQTQLIIAPESNITFDFYANITYKNKLLKEIAEKFNAPVQFGALAGKSNQSKKFNSSFLISENGEILKRYDKNLLLYFGEKYPAENLLNNILEFNFSSLKEGQSSEIFDYKNLKWKTTICSEILYPNYFKHRSDSLDFIVNQTNEAWFNHSKLLNNLMWQAAIIRAVENRTPIIKTGNQSYNGIIYLSGKYKKVSSKFNYHVLKLD